MHIRLLYKKVLYVFLSLAIVIANTQSAYAATSIGGWTATDSLIAGANTTINAVKGAGATGMRSVVTVAASAGNVGKHLIKGGGSAALAFAMIELADNALDWVLDPANNRVKYTIPATTSTNLSPNDLCDWGTGYIKYSEIKAKADQMCGSSKPSIIVIGPSGSSVSYDASCTYSSSNRKGWCTPAGTPAQEKYIPIDTVAAKVASNAAAGHAPSQDVVKAVALERFAAGEYDTALDAAAVADPTVTPTDPSVPFDPSSIIAAIESIKSIIDNAFSSLSAKINSLAVSIGIIDGKVDNIAAEQQRTMQVINDGMADVVAANNATGARVGDVVAAIEALEGNMLTGEVLNDAIDKVIAAGHTDTASIVAAIEAIEGNTLTGEVLNDAIDRVIANDDAIAQRATEATEAAEAARTTADQANTTAVTDAIEAQTEAMTTTDPTTGEKSLKLPAFCGFAPVVCDYITWVKGEYGSVMEWVKAEPETMPDDPIVVADDPSGIGNIFQDKAEAGYVSFESQCPNDVLIPVSLMGASQTLTISYTPFCHFASLIRYAVILGAWISGLLIVTGGRARE